MKNNRAANSYKCKLIIGNHMRVCVESIVMIPKADSSSNSNKNTTIKKNIQRTRAQRVNEFSKLDLVYAFLFGIYFNKNKTVIDLLHDHK